jgi:hypothetical protein
LKYANKIPPIMFSSDISLICLEYIQKSINNLFVKKKLISFNSTFENWGTYYIEENVARRI